MKRHNHILAVGITCLSLLVACSPESGLVLPASEPAAIKGQLAGTSISQDSPIAGALQEVPPASELVNEAAAIQNAPETPATAEGSTVVSSDGDETLIVVDAPELTEEELAALPPGTSDSGMGEIGPFDTDNRDGYFGDLLGPEEQDPSTWPIYVDGDYGYSVTLPPSFLTRYVGPDFAAAYTPPPTAALSVMSPTLASSDLGDLEIPELSIRLHATGPISSLEVWLREVGVTKANGGETAEPYTSAGAVGIRVCPTTLIGAGCSIFFQGNDLVYQLIPSDIIGEAITSTFRIVQ